MKRYTFSKMNGRYTIPVFSSLYIGTVFATFFGTFGKLDGSSSCHGWSPLSMQCWGPILRLEIFLWEVFLKFVFTNKNKKSTQEIKKTLFGPTFHYLYHLLEDQINTGLLSHLFISPALLLTLLYLLYVQILNLSTNPHY